MREIKWMKFEGKATDEETRNIFVFPIPCMETNGILPKVHNEMVTRPKSPCNDANRLTQLEMNSGIDEESAATIITIGTYMTLMRYLPSICNSSSSPLFHSPYIFDSSERGIAANDLIMKIVAEYISKARL